MDVDKRTLQRFGREIARTRKMADVTQDALARELGVSPSHISNIERGYRSPVASFVPKLDAALQVDGRLVRLWGELTGSGRPAWLAEVATLIREASAVMDYQNAVLPGLLQTESYARELITAGTPWASSDDVAVAVDERMRRAQEFVNAEEPLLWVVLDQTIIQRKFVPEAVRREQLDQIVRLVESERISVQVVATHYLGHPGLTGPFKVITPGSGADVVYAESIHEGQVITAAQDVARYRLLFGRLQAVALGPAESLLMIRRELDDD
ncbi:helix-turn-helix domain-containing protein [Streptomonospora litoralis]|uniref:helix-turn-helix domain-containing protein n=1 Tax=Streptomonospora litoralis TaxID=2498135 RepID=UPI0013F170F3|nr:helix-turn-helix transcriptional regulator [Streptomonospora litoralis]